jgi:hypothetical protein
MPSLFTLPSQLPLSTSGAPMAACTLTFSVSGTSTPQNTYSDIALTAPHANPVIADSAGLFAPIYLDASLPNYRAVLKTVAGVTLKTWDNIPSNQNTAQQFRLKHTTPEIIFEETDAPSGDKKWRIRANGGELTIDLLSDDESTAENIATLTRTGLVPGSLNFAGQFLRVNGVLVATQESGTFECELSGMTTTVTGTIVWRRTGSKTTFTAPSQIAGTSNSANMVMTGFGAFLPAASIGFQPTMVRDNGSAVVGSALLTPTGMTFTASPTGAGFTTSGSKGIPAGWQCIIDSDAAGIA